MKKQYLLFILLLTFFNVPQIYAQEGGPLVIPLAEYKASMPGWEVDIKKAITESQRTGKPILANFTGTDWCGWCIRLKKEVFITEEFNNWAKDNVVLLELDFPRRFKLPEEIAQQNSELQQAFGVRGFPTLWVFDVSVDPNTGKYNLNGKAKTGYVAGGPNKWIKDLENKMNQPQ